MAGGNVGFSIVLSDGSASNRTGRRRSPQPVFPVVPYTDKPVTGSRPAHSTFMHSPAPSSASRQSGFAALRQHGGDVHIVDRLRGFMRYRWVAAGVFGAVLLASGLYSWWETPMYRA